MEFFRSLEDEVDHDMNEAFGEWGACGGVFFKINDDGTYDIWASDIGTNKVAKQTIPKDSEIVSSDDGSTGEQSSTSLGQHHLPEP